MPFRPVNSGNSYTNNLGQVNDMIRQLNKEQQIKTFKGAGNINAVLIGKYAEDKYGFLFTDSAGDRRILLGAHPTTGEPGLWISKDGIDVVDELTA